MNFEEISFENIIFRLDSYLFVLNFPLLLGFAFSFMSFLTVRYFCGFYSFAFLGYGEWKGVLVGRWSDFLSEAFHRPGH